MHDTIVKMKDGREFKGSLHYFRPRWGWMSLFAGPDDLINRGLPIPFRAMESATTLNERLSVHRIGDCDEIARAREAGWDPDEDPASNFGNIVVRVPFFEQEPLDVGDREWVAGGDGIDRVLDIWKREGDARRSMLVRRRAMIDKPLDEGEVCTLALATPRCVREMVFSRMDSPDVAWFWIREERVLGP